ncbi:MAG TPA: phosphoribosyl-ATP diphosphatase [Aquabacterium sp.]|nr:phosphoribosyl-ATP diphosphatase [Aquabacterium sp.]
MTSSTMPTDPQATSADTIDVLQRLAEVIESRKGGDPDKSYVARLFHKGTDAVLKKIGEEACETVMAAKDLAHQPGSEQARQALVGEMADLWFHSMVAMAHLGLSPRDVVAELARREGLSGLGEFASRARR